MRRTLACASTRLEHALCVAATVSAGCGHPTVPPPPSPPPAKELPQPANVPHDTDAAPAWPEPLATALAGRGEPHAQPIVLPLDPHGRERWLAFVGTHDVAWGAWRVTGGGKGEPEIEPTEHWPVGVRVLGAVVNDGIAYVLLESIGVLNQPAGLRAIWIDGTGRPSPFEASPMALADVHDLEQLASHRKTAAVAMPDRTATLVATLQAASASTTALARAFAAEGVDVHDVWQSLFSRRVGHLDAEGAASSPLGARVLAIVRDTAAAPACGADTCEAWSDRGRAIVRFASEAGRWVVRAVFEDAPTVRPSVGTWPSRPVETNPTSSAVEPVLRARARNVLRVLGEATLSSTGARSASH